MSGYKVYKKDETSYFSLIGTTTNIYYVDGSEYISLQYPQMYIQYYVKAYNNDREYSFPSNEEQIKVYDNNAQKLQHDNEDVLKEQASGIGQNYPNPFNPSTQISYQLPENSFVNLVVYNAIGQKGTELVNQNQTSGKYTVQFNASNLPSGVYIYKIQAGEFSSAKKLLLTK